MTLIETVSPPKTTRSEKRFGSHHLAELNRIERCDSCSTKLRFISGNNVDNPPKTRSRARPCNWRLALHSMWQNVGGVCGIPQRRRLIGCSSSFFSGSPLFECSSDGLHDRG